uniref:Uncharacterized protein n=1 Tax=Anguilla anguilla TaxID=7936 RepID=A0A0E9W8H2_ANGAN
MEFGDYGFKMQTTPPKYDRAFNIID